MPTVASGIPQETIPVRAFNEHLHDWQRVSLADPHRFKVHRWHRRARKTTLALNKLILAAFTTPNRIFAYIAPTYKQAKAIIVQDPLMLKRYLPEGALTKPFNESELIGTFRSGSKLIIRGADDPDSTRGINLYGVVLDEYALFKPTFFSEILYPVLMQNGGWCDFYFTPKGRNHAWELWKRGGQPAYPDWATFDLTADTSGLLSEEALSQARHEMGDDLYRQEMLCEFLEDVQSVFRGLSQCIAGELESSVFGRDYVMGVDLGRMHDATVLTVLDKGTRHVVAWQRMTESHWALQKQAIAALAYRYPSLVVVDATGFGSPIVEDLQQLGLSVEGVTISSNTVKQQLIDGLRIAIADRLITFPQIDQLIKELQDYELTLGDRGQVYYAAPPGEGNYDDSVISLALAVHGLKGELYAPRFDNDASYDSALSMIPANGGYGFR